jgi:type IV pilus assembly protein PilQ
MGLAGFFSSSLNACSPLRIRWLSALVLVQSLAANGCALHHPQPPQPTVQELIQEALNASSQARELAIVNENSVDVFQEPTQYETPILSDEMVSIHPDSNLGLIETQPQGPRVSEEFIETDIREALFILAEEAEIDLVLDEEVAGVVNTRIDDLPIDIAIEKVLLPLGFVAARHGNRVVVAPADPSSPLFSYVSERAEYRPLHLDAATLMKTVPAAMEKFVSSIEGSNLILVEAPRNIREQIVDRFTLIDQPVPQVTLEAIICVVSPDSGFQLGLDWQHAVELNGKTALKLGAQGLALNGSLSQPGLDSVFSDFATTSAFVKLLNEKGFVTIRASPHVMAKDGQKANISINRETFFSTQPNTGGNSDENSAFFFQQNIQKVESGITLDITPRIRGDMVTIEIEKAEVSEDIRNANTELALNPYPIINRRSVSTTVHVKDGKTIVIGGLVQQETIDRVNSVPGLSRIPLLGYLFKSKQRQTREADVVIFISPRIVKPCLVD